MELRKLVMEALVLVCMAAAGPGVRAMGIGPRALVCYVAGWSGLFKPSDISHPELCSVLLYAFVPLNDDGTLQEERDADPASPPKLSLSSVAAKASPETVVGMSIGGWAAGSEKYSSIVSKPEKRKVFIDSIIKTVNRWGLRAVEVSWISPTLRGGLSSDTDNFSRLVEELGAALRALPANVTLGVALPVADRKVEEVFDLSKLGQHADWLRVQGHDLHGHWEPFTGVNAPLYGSAYDNASVTAWLKVVLNHVQPDRLILGMPAFGRTYLLADSPVPGTLGARTVQAELFSNEGMMNYNEICPHLEEGELQDEDDDRRWSKGWDAVSKTPYAATNRRKEQGRRGFITYDDPPSIRLKVKLAVDSGLAGVGLFTIDMDDYAGRCGPAFPLLTAAHQALQD